MAIKLSSNSSGTTGHLGIDSNIALTVNSVNCVVVSNSISSAAWEGSLATNIVTPAALNLDCSTGNYFTKSITSGSNVFTVSNVPSGRAYALTLELNVSGGATATFWTGVEWPNNDTAPTLIADRRHVFTFVTDDGGTIWRATFSINYST